MPKDIWICLRILGNSIFENFGMFGIFGILDLGHWEMPLDIWIYLEFSGMLVLRWILKILNFPNYLANILKHFVILSTVQSCTVYQLNIHPYGYYESFWVKVMTGYRHGPKSWLDTDTWASLCTATGAMTQSTGEIRNWFHAGLAYSPDKIQKILSVG